MLQMDLVNVSRKSGPVPLFFSVHVFRPAMDKKKAEAILEERLRPVIETEGYELVEVEVSQSGRQRIIRLYVDRSEGISIEQCGRLSRLVGPLIETMELFEGRYVLEVSSPGVTRSLKREQDFVRFSGRLARLSLSEVVEGRMQWVGDLRGVEGSDILLWPVDGTQLVRIPQSVVRAARLEYESPEDRAARQKKLSGQT
jgi:ribosome maturation factor RimP